MTLKDYFFSIPTEYINHIELDDREKVFTARTWVEGSYTTKSNFFTEVFDEKNGFMSIASAWDGESCRYEITYWNKSDKKRLIGVCRKVSSMIGEEFSTLFLLSLENGNWILHNDLYPSFHLKDFIDEKEFSNIPEESKDYITSPPIVISLPRKGKNILVEISEPAIEEELTLLLNSIKNKRYELVWNDGKFQKVLKN
ncbi:MAG: hypothetical protein OHK0038_09590 [Flammeovirgaceae bacterium]